MFLSKHDLKLAYGVDLQLASAYVDRGVPLDNLYWKNREIYIPSAPGYFFMPIFADLLFRCGADKEYLIGNEFFEISEGILHSAALLEHEIISWEKHVEQVFQLVAPHVKNHEFYEELGLYFSRPILIKLQNSLLGTPFPSLNRADSYLLLLVCIPPQGLDLKKAVESWYALMTYFLILDDLSDIKSDLKNNDENVLIDAGLNEAGFKKVSQMIDNSISVLSTINPVMANRIDHKREIMDLQEVLKSIISQS